MGSSLNYKVMNAHTGELISIYPINDAVRVLANQRTKDEEPLEPLVPA
jgi:hypothetical protein